MWTQRSGHFPWIYTVFGVDNNCEEEEETKEEEEEEKAAAFGDFSRGSLRGCFLQSDTFSAFGDFSRSAS